MKEEGEGFLHAGRNDARGGPQILRCAQNDRQGRDDEHRPAILGSRPADIAGLGAADGAGRSAAGRAALTAGIRAPVRAGFSAGIQAGLEAGFKVRVCPGFGAALCAGVNSGVEAALVPGVSIQSRAGRSAKGGAIPRVWLNRLTRVSSASCAISAVARSRMPEGAETLSEFRCAWSDEEA